MRNIWALPTLLRLAIAAQPPFNVHEDLFAFPQYEVVWQDNNPVSHEYASEKLSLKQTTSSAPPDASAQSLSKHHASDPPDSPAAGEHTIASYEILMFDNQRYLCSIPYIPPVIPSSPSNRTVDDEANELALAVHRGQKLLKGMEGNCIYFISGWWSYSFCYNEGVRQFHPLPSGRNVPMYPPVEDKSVGAYVLGRFHGKEASGDDHIDYDDETSSSKKASKKDESVEETGIAKLEVKGHEGSTRYLAQHLKGGTVCDLTGEARSIEVQFRCENLPTDRITVIKETSICQYRMVISTPRLCNDAAFRPPKGPKAHPIACSPVIASESMRAYIAARESAAAEYEASQRVSANKGANKYLDDLRAVFGVETVDANADSMTGEYDDEMPDTEHNGEHRRTLKKNLPRVGDIEVGGHNIIPEGTVLEKGIVVGGTGNEKHITTIARSDGYTASEKELSKLNIHGGKELELIKDRVRRTADGADWQIDVVETARGKELRGIIGDSEEKKAQKAKAAKKSKLKENKAEEEEAYDDEADDEYENAEGSEERYKEEL